MVLLVMFKISVEKTKIIDILSVANEIVSSRTTPVLANIYLSVDDGNLLVRATDLTISFESILKIEEGENGSLLVICDKLLHAIMMLPNAAVTIEQIDNSTIKIYSATENNAEYTLYCSDKDAYPEFQSFPHDGYSLILQKEFKSMVRKISFAVSQDESRQNINGTFMDIEEENIVLVGTDGRRLSHVELDSNIENEPLKIEKGITVPLKMFTLIEKYSEEGQIGLQLIDRKSSEDNETSDNKILFIQLYNYYFSTALIDEEFPNYKRVIPESQQHLIEVDKDTLMSAIKQVSLLSEKTKKIIISIFENKMIINSDQAEVGKAKVEMACVHNGPDIKVALNYSFILDPLISMKEKEVIIGFTENNRALSIYPKQMEENFKKEVHIVMPMQLD